MTVPGVGLCEVFDDGSVRTLQPLSPTEAERLALWLEHEWPQAKNGMSGYSSDRNL